ncbi:hypothetical protein P7K49_009773 [Saguinus oedipus]|uniref:Beta-casein n=1 Tax=Saguinus oedipus TaxID=9490 RepID=A0ABQ9VKX6_SAGOE|nr:hypothetical protein P7K49_009773 [Saguinus oedipus]
MTPYFTHQVEILTQQGAPAQFLMSPEQFQHLQEIIIQQLNTPENDELPPVHQEPRMQPPTQLSSDFESLLSDEVVFSLLDLSPVFRSNSPLPNTTVKNVDLELTIPIAVTMEVEPSPVQQENHPIPTEQADFSLVQPDLHSPPLHSPEKIESPVQQEATIQTPDYPKEVEPSPVWQEFPDEPPLPLKEIEPSITQKEASGHPPKFTEEISPPLQQEIPAQPSERPGKFEPSPVL